MQTLQEPFQHAVQLAQKGETAEAHALLGQLRAAHDSYNAALWYAFTSASSAEASDAIEAAARLEPQNPTLGEARAWLREWRYKEDVAAASEMVASLPPHLKEVTERVVQEGEMVLWIGRPNPWRVLQRELMYMLLLVPASLATVYFMLRYFSFPHEEFFLIFRIVRYTVSFGIPTAAMFLGIWFAYNQAANMAYVLTGARLIFLAKQWHGETIKSYRQCTPDRWQIIERANGSGNLFMGDEIEGKDKDAHMAKIALIGIPNVRQVADLIKKTLPNAYY